MKTKTKSLVRIEGLYNDGPSYKMWAKVFVKRLTLGVWNFGFGFYFSLRKRLTDKWLVYDEARKDYKEVYLLR